MHPIPIGLLLNIKQGRYQNSNDIHMLLIKNSALKHWQVCPNLTIPLLNPNGKPILQSLHDYTSTFKLMHISRV